MKKISLLALALFCVFIAQADILIPKATAPSDSIVTDSVRIEKLEEEVSMLGQKMKPWGALRILGYAQFDAIYRQKVDEVNFTVRRGILGAIYSNKWGAAVFVANITERGVGVLDAFTQLRIPTFQWLSLTSGLFSEPFGAEIARASCYRETPERSRTTRTLFPGLKDLGASLVFKGPKGTEWNKLSVEAAILAGNGISLDQSAVFGDNDKDFGARIRYVDKTDNMNYRIGASYFLGNVYSGSYIDSLGATVAYSNYKMEDEQYVEANTDLFQRQYLNIEGEYAYDYSWGKSKIFGEFMTGMQPGLANSSLSSCQLGYMGGKASFSGSTDATAGDIYYRNFIGGFLTLVQSFGKKDEHSIVLSYDQYDPNLNVSGTECQNVGDVKFQTFGFGYIYEPIKYIRLMAFFDLNINEKTNLLGYTSDLKDNVITLRTQFSF